ncbi:MAG: AlpA family transcriptional regulator [Gammaproteobacteria bacterium]|nr:AlpA family transcriptional regulator [Gammaproteobacteria bacterium]
MRIMRLRSVMGMTGLARSTIYKYIAKGIFPAPIPLGARAVGWLESEVEGWIRNCAAQRAAPQNKSTATEARQVGVSA